MILVGLTIRKPFLYMIIFLLLVFLAISIDIPVLRQFLGFLYVAFVPGVLLLYIFKLHNLNLTVKILLSVGLSAAFFLISGLIINTLSLTVGFQEPLGTVPLLVYYGIITVALVVIAYFRNRDTALTIPNLSFTVVDKLVLLVPALFPLLVILGTRSLNLYDNNSLIIAVFILIAIYIVVVSLCRNRVTEGIFPIVIFLISISLLLALPLRSGHIVFGADTGREFYFFHETLSNLHWKMWQPSLVNSCLSITILPTIYHSLLKVDPDIIFKYFVCFLFAFTPLIIYTLARRYVSSFLAFLAAFFYMSQPVFLYTAVVVRINVGVFFIALALLVMFHTEINAIKSKLLFLIFYSAIVFSYYTGAYIFIFIIVLSWLVAKIFELIVFRIERRRSSAVQSREKASSSARWWQQPIPKNITFRTIFLCCALFFLWHGLAIYITFLYGVDFIQTVLLGFEEFFLLSARNPTAPQLMGQTLTQTVIPHQIEFTIYWITFGLIAIGVIGSVLKYRSMVKFNTIQQNEADIINQKLNLEYLSIAIACSIVAALMVFMPYISKGYDYHRLYILITIVLSTFFVTGAMIFTRYIRLSTAILIPLILMVYFSGISGLLDQAFSIPRRIIFNSIESSPESLMVPQEQDVSAAEWLGTYSMPEEKIYLYGYRREVVQSYGQFFITKFKYIGPKLQVSEIQKGYDNIFISTRELPGTITNSNDYQRLQQEFPEILNDANRIYSNGTAEILK